MDRGVLQYSLLIPDRILVAELPRFHQMILSLIFKSDLIKLFTDKGTKFPYLPVIFLQEGEDASVVLERYPL